MGLEPSSTPAAYRARRFQKSPLTHFAASPLRKRSRSVRLLGCKRPRGGSLSLPTFCEKKEGASGGGAAVEKSRKSGSPKIFSGTARGQFLSLLLRQSKKTAIWRSFLIYETRGLEPSSTPAAYRARRFQKSPLTHFAASPLRKRSRSVRLLGCKRPRGGSLSLPTFCEKKEGASGGGAAVEKSRKSGSPKIFSGTARGQFLSLLLRQSKKTAIWRSFLIYETRGLEPSSTPAAYRARRFQKSPLTHFAASPLRKRSRSARLLGCKRPRGGSLSLPTFCEKKGGAGNACSRRPNRMYRCSVSCKENTHRQRTVRVF